MIIENGAEHYMECYEEFKEEYIKGDLTVQEMMNKYGWGKNDYRKALHHAWNEGIPPRKAGRRRRV